jgi:phage tail sheath protein FI
MPEYLSPGVYVEEVSFRSKSIEGVPTSTTGFAGVTRYGPVRHPNGPTTCEPRLITSFTEFERVYGGLEKLTFPSEQRDGYLAHAARAFFDNGGKRLYVSRVFVAKGPNVPADDFGVAAATLDGQANSLPAWRARWPGAIGGEVVVECIVRRSGNVTYTTSATHPTFPNTVQAQRAKHGAVVEIAAQGAAVPPENQQLDANALAEVRTDPATNRQRFFRGGAEVTPNGTDIIRVVELRVLVRVGAERLDVYDELGTHADQKRDIAKILERDNPEDENAMVWLDLGNARPGAVDLMVALRGQNANNATASQQFRLTGGHDGELPTHDDFGGKEADPDNAAVKATGLEALGEIDDIAIVAVPDGGGYDALMAGQVAGRLIAHAEKERYRIAIVDAPRNSSMNAIRKFRGQLDTKYGALYHPWVEILDPLERPAQGAPPKRLLLPPSGFVAGIYARSDIERGVYKAPANEVVRGLTKFEANINKARQDVLNPEGINALRFFEGRGNRVWGARTLSSDPEWKYVNVRRLFIYIEHSIDKGTQWAVFEPNNPKLWANVRNTIEDFLYVLWKDSALMGNKPEEAFFVRCDRTTMSQNDLDNGRLICLIGVCPTKPAEFVIFRIGQWTADAKQN